MLTDEFEIELPIGGLNKSDPSYSMMEGQAESLVNMRIVMNTLESIRGSSNFITHITPDATKGTTSVAVFRKRDGTVQYLLGYNGSVYRMSDLYSSPVLLHTFVSKNKINMIQFNEFIYLFNGYDTPVKYNGTSFIKIGIDAPTTIGMTTTSAVTIDADFYYTYYDSVNKIESNPSPRFAQPFSYNAYVNVVASPLSNVDKIRIYRTGDGIYDARLAREVPNVTGSYQITITDADLATKEKISFIRNPPSAVFENAIIHNNQLVCWSSQSDKIWFSNQGEGDYFPVSTMIDKTELAAGGVISIRTGDGDNVVALASFNNYIIVWKQRSAYRVTETEIGFYAFSNLNIEGCVASGSVQSLTNAVVWLSYQGFMTFGLDEVQQNIGYFIKSETNKIEKLERITSCFSRGFYIVSFNGYTYIYDQDYGWTGKHSINARSWFEDKDGKLFYGRDGICGLAEYLIHEFGILKTEVQSQIVPIEWVTRGFSFGRLSRYKRIRRIRVYGRSYSLNTQQLRFQVLSRNDEILHDTAFNLEDTQGIVVFGTNNKANSDILKFKIYGNIAFPIRIDRIVLEVELGASKVGQD